MTTDSTTTLASDAARTVTEREAKAVERANATGLQPIVFVHGLWLLPSSWARWMKVFGDAGYAALAPGWPDDPETVAEANAHPEVMAHKTIGQVADHFEAVAREHVTAWALDLALSRLPSPSSFPPSWRKQTSRSS
jgi:hypothetical protein